MLIYRNSLIFLVKKLEMNRYSYLLLLSFGFLIWSCNPNAQETVVNRAPANWEFEKVDSLQIDILGNPVLADVEFGKVLVYDTQSREFLILNLQGEVQSRFIKNPDSFDNFGFPLLLPAFLDENQVMIPGTSGLFIYDLEGNMEAKIPHPEVLSGGTFSNFPGYSIDYLKTGDNQLILSKSFRIFESYVGQKEFYSRFRALEVLNLKDTTSLAWIPFPEDSRFKNGNGYIQSDFEPYFAADEKGVYLAFAGEPRLHQFAWSGDSLSYQKTLDLKLPDFAEITGQPLEKLADVGVSTNLSTAAIRKVSLWGDRILILFYPGLSTEQAEAITMEFQKGNREEALAMRKSFLGDRKMGMAVVDKNSFQQLGIAQFPDWVNPGGFVREGEDFWFQKAFNPDKEEDFLKIYKVKLVEK